QRRQLARTNGWLPPLLFVLLHPWRGSAALVSRPAGWSSYRLLEMIGEVSGEVGDAHRVAPLVVVPGDNLEEVVAHVHGKRQVHHAGVGGADKVAANELGLAHTENALELLALAGLD